MFKVIRKKAGIASALDLLRRQNLLKRNGKNTWIKIKGAKKENGNGKTN
jgi:hypothetical protein